MWRRISLLWQLYYMKFAHTRTHTRNEKFVSVGPNKLATSTNRKKFRHKQWIVAFIYPFSTITHMYTIVHLYTIMYTKHTYTSKFTSSSSRFSVVNWRSPLCGRAASKPEITSFNCLLPAQKHADWWCVRARKNLLYFTKDVS